MSDRFDPDAVFRHALSLHQAGEVERAIALYRQLLPDLSGHPLLFLALGTALSQQGRCDEGVGWLDKAVTAAPDMPMAWSNRGNALRLLKQYEDSTAPFC